MSIEHTTIEIGQLVQAEYNPRKMPDEEMLALMDSLEEFGFVEPVIARVEDRLLIGGHQRLTAYQKLLRRQGMPTEQIKQARIPVVLMAGVTDERAKILNVALNKIHGEWDFDKLSVLLADLASTANSAESLGLTGFNEAEIADILALGSSAADDAQADQDEIDPDALLADQRRLFSFEVATTAEADLCIEVLRKHGMTGPRDAAQAFVAALTKAR